MARRKSKKGRVGYPHRVKPEQWVSTSFRDRLEQPADRPVGPSPGSNNDSTVLSRDKSHVVIGHMRMQQCTIHIRLRA